MIPPNATPFIAYVVDSCDGCDQGFGPGWDVYDSTVKSGAWLVNWTAIECPGSQLVSYEFEGSNQWYIKLQVRAHKVPLLAVRWDSGAGLIDMPRSGDNHFLLTGQTTSLPLTFEFESVFGEKLTDTINPASFDAMNGVVIPGNIQFSDSSDGVDGGSGDGGAGNTLSGQGILKWIF